MEDGGMWHWTSPSRTRPRSAAPGPSKLNPTTPCRPVPSHAVPSAGAGDVPPLACGGAVRPAAPGAGAHPRAGRSLRLGGRQLGLPRQAAGNGPGATGCGAAPAAAEQARPAGQAAAAPETGSRAVPTARDDGVSAKRPWLPLSILTRSSSCCRPGSLLPAGVLLLARAGASGLGVIKPSEPREPTGSDSPQWD